VIVGSFIWGGGSKTKSKKKEASEERGIDSEHQTADNPDALTSSIPPALNLSPTSSMGVWPASRGLDMRNAHVDIDLMRG
jgi:hypothetical protein